MEKGHLRHIIIMLYYAELFVFFGHLCKLFMTHSWLLFLSDCLTSGVLVVNVTWRKRTYVGTLLDCTKHDWAPPR